MKPIGPLMREHRLIERMIGILDKEYEKMKQARKIDRRFLDAAVDFFRVYADKTHHGKEEDILFRDLSEKQLSIDHKKIIDGLVKGHIYAREIVAGIEASGNDYFAGKTDAFNDVITNMGNLLRFYPGHIEIEDNDFFYPSMEYFSKEEQDRMLDEFREFDSEMIHEKYRTAVEDFEKMHK
jgi:hemerythrin-like domain-containing protein